MLAASALACAIYPGESANSGEEAGGIEALSAPAIQGCIGCPRDG